MASHAWTILLALTALGLGGCSTEPRYAPCSNDSECKEPRYAYCMQNHCVECVSRASCNGGACNGGVCEIECKDARGCLHGDACVDGKCAPR